MEVRRMNPDQNKNGSALNGPFTLGLIASAVVPVVLFIVIAFADVNPVNGITIPTLAFLFCVISAIAIIAANFYVQRKVKNCLLGLAEVCRDFANGDRSVRAVVSDDRELFQLSSALNSILDNQSSSPSVAMGAAGNDAAALQAQIEKLLQEVSAVGDGDLRVQAEVTPDTLGVLADSFNYMIEELAKVVGRVQSTAVQVTNATRRILDRSAELAQATETQVKQIAQTTESVEALAIFIQNVARNAQLSVDVAQEALRSANNGQQAVRQTIEGMMLIRENVQETAKKIKRLGERSNEIGEIVRIIEDIADQTNLLALNAAIQSAMAGEHGRGFAVVADEIRLLAERSTESTKRIATLVKSIQGDTYEAVVAMEDSTQEVVKGSQLADDAGRSLNSIYSAVERQAQMIENIARAANEQTPVSEAVAVAMGRISEITRQTDAGTQEAAVSVSYLAELSEQLRASVSTFRLPDRTNDMLGSFSNMAPMNDISDKGDAGFGGQLGSSSDNGNGNGWGQSFSGNFPPLPEPGNTGSLVSLGSRSNQFSLGNQQNFSNPPLLPAGGQPSFGQGNYGDNGSNQPFFGNQMDFGDLGNFDSQQQGFNPGQDFNPGQGFGQGQDFNQGQGFGQGQDFGQGQGFGQGQSFNQGQGQGFNPGQGFNSGQNFNQGQDFNSGLGAPQFNPGANYNGSVPPYYQPANSGQGPQGPNSGLLPTPYQQQKPAQNGNPRPRWQSGEQNQ
jgi:methyl-accepting chemotaxis protein